MFTADPVLITAPESRTLETSAICHALSGREKEVLGLVATGLSNKVIAIRLGLSPHTVKRHVTNLFNKLDLVRRSQATAWYYLNPESSGCCRSPRSATAMIATDDAGRIGG